MIQSALRVHMEKNGAESSEGKMFVINFDTQRGWL